MWNVAQDGRPNLLGHPSNQSYVSWISKKEALKGAKFGLPWKRVWEYASKNEGHKSTYDTLKAVIDRIRQAGAEIIDETDFPSAEEIIPPYGWDWYTRLSFLPNDLKLTHLERDYGSKIGHTEHSEFTVVKTEFYNDLKAYLSTLTRNPCNIHSLDD